MVQHTKKKTSYVDAELQAAMAEVEIPTTGDIKADDLAVNVEVPADFSRIDEKADELAFMEERVEIYLHDAQTPNEEPIVHVGNGGDNVWLQRGQNHTIKRKHLLNLATARPTNYRTIEARAPDGSMTVRLKAHSSLKYPFSVNQDSARGHKWLQGIMGG